MATKPVIPSMGGRELGPVFDRYIEVMEFGLDVVEVGAWLGAGTYELAFAMREHGHDQSTLHVYDRFKANKVQVKKAAGKHRYPKGMKIEGDGAVKIRSGQNTLPLVKANLREFPFVEFYRGEIGRLKYRGRKIGVLVVDAIKRDPHFRALMKKLEPHLAPGAVIFLMDFYYHEKIKGCGTECQGRYINKSGRYDFIERVSGLSCAIFKYKGKQ